MTYWFENLPQEEVDRSEEERRARDAEAEERERAERQRETDEAEEFQRQQAEQRSRQAGPATAAPPPQPAAPSRGGGNGLAPSLVWNNPDLNPEAAMAAIDVQRGAAERLGIPYEERFHEGSRMGRHGDVMRQVRDIQGGRRLADMSTPGRREFHDEVRAIPGGGGRTADIARRDAAMDFAGPMMLGGPFTPIGSLAGSMRRISPEHSFGAGTPATAWDVIRNQPDRQTVADYTMLYGEEGPQLALEDMRGYQAQRSEAMGGTGVRRDEPEDVPIGPRNGLMPQAESKRKQRCMDIKDPVQRQRCLNYAGVLPDVDADTQPQLPVAGQA